MSLSGNSSATPLRRLPAAARRRVDYLGLAPNLLVSLHPDYVMTHRLDAVAPDRTVVECQWLFAPEDVGAVGFDPSFAVDFWDVTNRQDWAACEGVQRGLRSRGYRPGPFSTTEDAVAGFVRLVARAYLCGGWSRPQSVGKREARPSSTV
jgi:Rieske 2Fe-2S family protein